MSDVTARTEDGTEKELASLQQEVSRLRRLVASQGSQAYDAVRDQANQAIERAAPQARHVANRLRHEGTAMADVAREHPSAVTVTMVTAAGLGFLIGYLMGQRNEPPRSRAWHW